MRRPIIRKERRKSAGFFRETLHYIRDFFSPTSTINFEEQQSQMHDSARLPMRENHWKIFQEEIDRGIVVCGMSTLSMLVEVAWNRVSSGRNPLRAFTRKTHTQYNYRTSEIEKGRDMENQIVSRPDTPSRITDDWIICIRATATSELKQVAGYTSLN